MPHAAMMAMYAIEVLQWYTKFGNSEPNFRLLTNHVGFYMIDISLE